MVQGKKLTKEIENLRESLNNMLESGDYNKVELLELSKKLDKLILLSLKKEIKARNDMIS